MANVSLLALPGQLFIDLKILESCLFYDVFDFIKQWQNENVVIQVCPMSGIPLTRPSYEAEVVPCQSTTFNIEL